MNLLLTLLLGVASPASPEPAAKPTRVLLCYIPFAVETVVPVTVETICERAHYTVTLESRERLAALETILSDRKATSRFDPNLVRLAVARDSPGSFVVIVDSDGQLREGTEKSGLSTKAFAALKKLLSELTAGMRLKGSRVVGDRPGPTDYFLNSESNADRTRA